MKYEHKGAGVTPPVYLRCLSEAI